MYLAASPAHGPLHPLDPTARRGILPRLGPTGYLLIVELRERVDAGASHVDDRDLADALGIDPMKVRESARRCAKYGYLHPAGQHQGEPAYLIPAGYEPEHPRTRSQRLAAARR